MKLAKLTDGSIDLVEVEDGKEVGGQRSEESLYADGYKKACPSSNGEGEWKEYPTCWVQEEVIETEEPNDEESWQK